MTSAKRIKANLRNARRSTGPTSARGKANSRMNALKHGLDAETLILPGEREADYQDRREAWVAKFPPRDPLEASLLEQAVRLSWQLDRADRVCAAHLAERIQLLQSPEHRRQQADAQAAEAARIGEQLLADPPPPKYNLAKIHARLVRLRQTEFAPYTPIFDLPFARAKLATKRFRMPIPPDDPGHPERLLRRLKSTAAGCTWLLDRWIELRAALANDQGWQPEERLRAVRLLAKLPADAVDDPTVRKIYFSCVILGGKDAQVLADQVREMADCEFEYFVERMAGRGLTGQAPPDSEAAREWLLWMVDGVMIDLHARAAMHAEREEAAFATDRLAFDPSPAGRRLLRLQSRRFGSLLRTINRLTEARRRPDALVPRPKPAEDLAARPSGAMNCEKVRNEPNADAQSEARTLVGWVQPTGSQAAHSVACTYPASSADPTGEVAATPVGITNCEKLRNEPTAGSQPGSDRSPSVAIRAVENRSDGGPEDAEAVHHPLGTDQEAGDGGHECDDPGPVEGERSVRRDEPELQRQQPDQTHGQEGDQETHERREQPIPDRELRFAGAASSHERSSLDGAMDASRSAVADRPSLAISMGRGPFILSRSGGENQPRRRANPAGTDRAPLRENSGRAVRFHSEVSYNLHPADALGDGPVRAASAESSSRSAHAGNKATEGVVMDSSELFSQFSINRLDGEPVPDDVQILLPHRDELAGRSGIRLVLDEDWTPWLDATGLGEAVHSDPAAAADIRARAEVCRHCAFVADDGAGRYLGYWRGPARRKIAICPLVVLDTTGQFHLCAAPSFAEAVLERAYAHTEFPELRAWLQSLGISVAWESPSQLTLPHEKLPPRELHRQLFEQYHRSLASH